MIGTLYTLSHLTFTTRSPLKWTEEQKANNAPKDTQLWVAAAEFTKTYRAADEFGFMLANYASFVLIERLPSQFVLSDNCFYFV